MSDFSRGRSRSLIDVESNSEGYVAAFHSMSQQSGDDAAPTMSEAAFMSCMESLHLDLSRVEISRVWRQVDEDQNGHITEDQFLEAITKRRFLRRIASLYLPATAEEGAENGTFAVPEDYDWSRSTADNYRGGGGGGEQHHFGEFAKFREKMDYEYHSVATEQRQLWQDRVIKSVAERNEGVEFPWIVYTCGPMGAGKGYALSWMSEMGYFPLEQIVHVDADHFKTCMPEWAGYVERDAAAAGTMCHKESGFLQEIAQEVAMSQGQNVWIDGSLRDGEWFAMVFDDIRGRFPNYRIAIFVIETSEDLAWERCQSRAAKTGRAIPKSLFLDSYTQPDHVLRMLTPKVDFIARIDNEKSTPRLKAFEVSE